MTKSIKDRVKELEKQNRLLIDNLVDSIWVVDAETLRYEFSAPSYDKFTGRTVDELIGKPITDVLLPESLKKAEDLLKVEMEAYARGGHVAQSIELETLTRNGDKFRIEIRAKLMEDPSNSLKIVGITKDITAKKKAEKQLERLNRKLTKALAEKEKLLEEIKVLKELLPICSACKRIRDDDGRWWPLEAYIKEKTDSDFTHTICPDCKDVIYPDLE